MFVILMFVMFTVVTLTFRTYLSLTGYAGTYTSPGASGNQATPAPAPPRTRRYRLVFGSPPPPPMKTTSAGAYTGRHATARPGTQAQPPFQKTQRP